MISLKRHLLLQETNSMRKSTSIDSVLMVLLITLFASDSIAFTLPNTIKPFVSYHRKTSPSTSSIHIQNQEQMNVNAENKITEKDNERKRLKASLKALSASTRRGFYASSNQRSEAKELIENLARINPTNEPASAFYETEKFENRVENDVTIAGKWTLLYTNAPDITSLDSGTNLLPSIPNAKLGRIGQECNRNDSTISNVIEWKKPDWVSNIIKLGSNKKKSADDGIENENRILQKVVCEAKASPNEPLTVQLDLVGFELIGDTSTTQKNTDSSSGVGSIFEKPPSIDRIINGPAEILNINPIRLRGPLKAPFGKFEILYLDEEMRIIKTGQGYYAVNIREKQTWF